MNNFILKFNSGKKFDILISETILDATLRNSLLINHSCKRGQCGECKILLLDGVTECIYDEIGLHPSDKEAGYILSCARLANSDLLVDESYFSKFSLPEKIITPCKIQDLQFKSKEILLVNLRFPPNTKFGFIPGQYVNLRNNKGTQRSYSISNSDFSSGTINLQIKKKENGEMSQYWFNLAKVGDLLSLEGPVGSFILREVKNADLMFLANGTGIAPFCSMYDYISKLPEDEKPSSLVIYWGVRDATDLYHVFQNSSYRVVHVISRPNVNWNGSVGYVQDIAIANRYNWDKLWVYACGSEKMISDARQKLLGLGLSPSRFISEKFN